MAEKIDEGEQRLERDAEIESAGISLDKLVIERKIGPVYERKEIVDTCIEKLKYKNIILVGEHGVGKNAIVESITYRMVSSRMINFPFSRVIMTNYMLISQGWIYAGNLQSIIHRFIGNCYNKKAILFFDQLNLAIGFGTSENNPLQDIISAFDSSLSGFPDVRLIGAITPMGYQALQRIHSGFINRFEKVEIPPTGIEETKRILQETAGKILEKHGITIKIEKEVLDGLVEYYDRFCHWQKFPGKAFEGFSAFISSEGNKKFTNENLVSHIQNFTGLPEFIVKNIYQQDENKVKEDFKKFIFGQDKAIDEIVSAITRFKTELNIPNKPIASFLFAGPSGVGKTELAKVLARYLFGSDEKLLIYPMSQYLGAEGYMRLAASPSLYSNREAMEEGKLLKDVGANPFSVILFDEIDQASYQVRNTLYQILDEGRIVETTGKITFFRNCIIIMTTNAGMEEFFQTTIGFGSEEGKVSSDGLKEKIKEKLEGIFGEPFLNRLTDIVIFNPLEKDIIKKIARKTIDEYSENIDGLRKRKLKIEVDDKLFQQLMEKGYDRKYGARIMENAVREYCIDPVAFYISKNPSVKDKVFKLSLDSGGKVTIQ